MFHLCFFITEQNLIFSLCKVYHDFSKVLFFKISAKCDDFRLLLFNKTLKQFIQVCLQFIFTSGFLILTEKIKTSEINWVQLYYSRKCLQLYQLHCRTRNVSEKNLCFTKQCWGPNYTKQLRRAERRTQESLREYFKLKTTCRQDHQLLKNS